jgi:hypothetical protein
MPLGCSGVVKAIQSVAIFLDHFRDKRYESWFGSIEVAGASTRVHTCPSDIYFRTELPSINDQLLFIMSNTDI